MVMSLADYASKARTQERGPENITGWHVDIENCLNSGVSLNPNCSFFSWARLKLSATSNKKGV